MLSTILTVLLCLMILLLSGLRLLGWIPLAVLSGSMEPQYPVGSLIFVRPIAAEDVKLGDPITFYMADGRTLATHRVTQVDEASQSFKTKGDANAVEDQGTVSFDRLVGSPQFCVPLAGYVSILAGSAQGKMILGAALLVLVLLAFLPGRLMKTNASKRPGRSSQSWRLCGDFTHWNHHVHSVPHYG